MTAQEFSDQFDVLLNSSFIPNEFGEQANKIDIQLDEYEKSVFLTQAQEQLVINLYNGRNIEGLSFESAEESRRYLKELTVTQSPANITKITTGLYPNSYRIDMSSYGNLLFITRETVRFKDNSECEMGEIAPNKPWQTGDNLIVEVVPITQDEYHRIKRNPYKKFNDERVLRIENNNEWYLYSKYALSNYSIDYIKKPKPIIISSLGNDLKIDGYSFSNTITPLQPSPNTIYKDKPCELNPILHRTILLEAVKLAKIVKQNQIRNEMLGNMPGQLVHPPMQPVNQRPN